MQYCPCEASEQKLGQKPESELKVIELSYYHHSMSLKNKLGEKECQNWTKNDQVMPNLMFLCQSGIWPILCQLMAILAKLLDMDFKFVCLVFTLTLIYIPILKSIRPKFAILSPKILQKLTKVAKSQNLILPKCHSPKSLLLYFSMNFSETFRINVNTLVRLITAG